MATDSNGDLRMARVDEAHNQLLSFLLLREEYAQLPVLDVSVDKAGTAYVATVAGGRETQDRKPLICRLTEQDDVACFEIPSFVDTMRAVEPGVVYAVTPDDQLMRFDFPS